MQKDSRYKTASSYAEAWFGAAKDNNSEDKVFAEVDLIRESLKNDTKLWTAMMTSKVSKDFIDDVAHKAKFSEISRNTLKLIAENGRLNLLEQITDDFSDLFYEKKGIVKVNVDTAVALSATQDKQLRKVLQDKLHKEIELIYHIKPEVLGGLAIRFKSFLIDDTLSAKLKKFEKLMTEQ